MRVRNNLLLLLSTVLCFLGVSASCLAAQDGKVVIGIIPEMNLVKQMDRFQPLADYLEQKAGFAVDIKPCSNYGQLYEEIRDGSVDGGFFGSFIYGVARAQLDIVPLARPVQPGGRSTYSGVLFVRKDSGASKPADMKGKTIALVDPATTAGYLVQKSFLAGHGIDMDKDLKVLWKGSHEAAIKAVLSREADIGGAKNTVVSKFRKENKVFDAAMDIVYEGPKKGVPDNTLAVRKGFDARKSDTLRKILLSMDHDPEGRKVLDKFGAIKFIATTDDHFKPLYDLVRNLNIDLATYRYKRR